MDAIGPSLLNRDREVVSPELGAVARHRTARAPEIIGKLASNRACGRILSRTVLGLVFLAVFTILLVGSARGVSAVGAQGIARGILLLGVVVALVGIIQKAVGSEAVYGFWYPPKGSVPFAPFINPNHFAGWMVMAMSLSIGYFAGGVARGPRGVKRDWRHRVLWLSSSEANETLLTGFAVVVMALSIVLSVSRSGLLCLASAILLSSWWMIRRQSSRPRRLIAATYLAFVLMMAASWLRAGAVIGLGVIAFQEFFDFTLQMPGAAALFVVLVAIAIHRPPPKRPEMRPPPALP